MATDHPSIFPALRYEDAPAAIGWLKQAFGFIERMVVPGPDGTIAHAELTLGNGMIMLGSVKEDAYGTSPRRLEGVHQTIYVHVADANAHEANARTAGADVFRPVEDTPYGSREYSCRDLEGHVWSFGTYQPFAGQG